MEINIVQIIWAVLVLIGIVVFAAVIWSVFMISQKIKNAISKPVSKKEYIITSATDAPVDYGIVQYPKLTLPSVLDLARFEIIKNFNFRPFSAHEKLFIEDMYNSENENYARNMYFEISDPEFIKKLAIPFFESEMSTKIRELYLHERGYFYNEDVVKKSTLSGTKSQEFLNDELLNLTYNYVDVITDSGSKALNSNSSLKYLNEWINLRQRQEHQHINDRYGEIRLIITKMEREGERKYKYSRTHKNTSISFFKLLINLQPYILDGILDKISGSPNIAPKNQYPGWHKWK